MQPVFLRIDPNSGNIVLHLIYEKAAVLIPKIAGSILLLLFILGFLACDHAVDYDTNSPPNPPFDPIPADGASGQNISLQLSWLCSDPDGDSLTYDLVLGLEMELPSSLTASNLTRSQFIPNELLPDTTYFWKVIARDNNNHIAESPLWHFSTYNPDWQISPHDGAIVTKIPETLTWDCSLLEGDSLTYNLYLGFDSDTPLILSEIEEGIFIPG